MRFTRLGALFLILAVPCAAYAQRAKKPTPRSRTIEGTVIAGGGSVAGMSDFIIESGGKRYSVVVDQRGLAYSPGTRMRVSYLGTCGLDEEIQCLVVTRFVRVASRAVDSASTKMDENGFQAFLKQFVSAVRKRDRAALELMMSATFEFNSSWSAKYEQPSVVFDSLDETNGEGWKQLEKSVATGTKPYKDSSPQTVTRVTNSNVNLVLFGLGSDGKWRWLRALGLF